MEPRNDLEQTAAQGAQGAGGMGLLAILIVAIVLIGLSVYIGLRAGVLPIGFPPSTNVTQVNPAGTPIAVGSAEAGQRGVATGAVRACDNNAAWRSDPDVAAALAKAALWPEVIAEAEHAAASEPVDTARMRADYDQMAKVAQTLRESDAGLRSRETANLAGRAMGLASRLAGGLADNTLDRQAAGTALAERRQAITAYDSEAAAQMAGRG